jgi:L-alanine-DL-glutamate epimerase-like enolase superfamily enzyme
VKIARIDSHSIKVPYTFGGSHQGEGLRTWTTNNILLVRVETDTGIVGWGEAFCYACTDAVRAALHNMVAPLAIGQDARDIARLSYDLQQKLHLFGRYGISIFALSGLDIALWDIAGKAANLPLHRLLGGAGRDSLPAYASLLKYRDPEKVAARARQAFDEGYRHIKLHETEEAEVRAARLAVGEGVAIMVDTNCP